MTSVAESIQYHMQTGATCQEAVQLTREELARQREAAKESGPKKPIAVGTRRGRRR